MRKRCAAMSFWHEQLLLNIFITFMTRINIFNCVLWFRVLKMLWFNASECLYSIYTCVFGQNKKWTIFVSIKEPNRWDEDITWWYWADSAARSYINSEVTWYFTSCIFISSIFSTLTIRYIYFKCIWCEWPRSFHLELINCCASMWLKKNFANSQTRGIYNIVPVGLEIAKARRYINAFNVLALLQIFYEKIHPINYSLYFATIHFTSRSHLVPKNSGATLHSNLKLSKTSLLVSAQNIPSRIMG